jgi:hypothetical protein
MGTALDVWQIVEAFGELGSVERMAWRGAAKERQLDRSHPLPREALSSHTSVRSGNRWRKPYTSATAQPTVAAVGMRLEANSLAVRMYTPGITSTM